MPSMLRQRWLGNRKGIQPVKKVSAGIMVVVDLTRVSDVLKVPIVIISTPVISCRCFDILPPAYPALSWKLTIKTSGCSFTRHILPHIGTAKGLVTAIKQN